MKTHNMLTLALFVIGSSAVAQIQLDAHLLPPSGPAPKVTISAGCRPKLSVAAEAVRDINSEASEAEYTGERQDAKRAIREAHAAVSTEGDNAVLGDIYLHMTVRELCRSFHVNAGHAYGTVAAIRAWGECEKVGVDWADRIQAELAPPPQPKGRVMK